MRSQRLTMSLTAAATGAAILTGCGLGTAGGYVPSADLAGPLEGISLEGATIAVGSKNFTEHLILGKMAVILFQSAGATTQDLTNVPGSNSLRIATLEGMMDFTWEYTGTAWISYLGETDPIPDAQAQFEAVRDADAENGLIWTSPSELDNTYALGVTQDNAEELGLDSISDLDSLPESEQTFCLSAEFSSRNDGFEPMLEHYDLPPAPNSRRAITDQGATYQALAQGECMAAEVFATDGRIPALDLHVLEDDRDFFPRYNLAGIIAEDLYEEYPQVEDIVAVLTDRLDNETMAALNAQVDVEGREPTDVAYDFLLAEGYVTEES